MIRIPRPHRPVWHAWTAAIGFAVAAAFSVPLAMEANLLLKTDDDPVAITEFSLMWSDVVSLRVVPVVEDDGINEALKRAGK